MESRSGRFVVNDGSCRPPGETGSGNRFGAEGATAPETLRQKDRTVGDALESSLRLFAVGSPKE